MGGWRIQNPIALEPWADVVHIIKHNLLIIYCSFFACGRSNERPYWWDVVRVFDDCAVGGH